MAGNSNSGGRNKKDAPTHIIQGTFRNDRHGEDSTPQPPKGDPVPPERLKGKAKAEWKRMVERLTVSKTLSLVDDAALYQYVQLYAETEQIRGDHQRIRKLAEQLKKAAITLSGSELLEAIKKVIELERVLAGQTVQLRQGHMAIRQYLVEFGMTPSARTRVKTSSGPKPTSAVDKFRQKFAAGGGTPSA